MTHNLLELNAVRLTLEDRMDLNTFLDVLGSHVGTLLLCGRFCLLCNTRTLGQGRIESFALLFWEATRSLKSVPVTFLAYAVQAHSEVSALLLLVADLLMR